MDTTAWLSFFRSRSLPQHLCLAMPACNAFDVFEFHTYDSSVLFSSFLTSELLCTSASALSTSRWAAKATRRWESSEFTSSSGELACPYSTVSLRIRDSETSSRSWLGLWAVNRRWMVRASDTFELQGRYLRRKEMNIIWWEQKDAITSWLSRVIETKNEETLNSHEGRRNVKYFYPVRPCILYIILDHPARCALYSIHFSFCLFYRFIYGY